MKIKFNGRVHTIIYTENDNGALNQSLYSFHTLKDAVSYLHKQVNDTLARLKDITGEDYEAVWMTEEEKKTAPNGYDFVSIDAGDGLEYTMELRNIPIRTTGKYENPDFVNEFVQD